MCWAHACRNSAPKPSLIATQNFRSRHHLQPTLSRQRKSRRDRLLFHHPVFLSRHQRLCRDTQQLASVVTEKVLSRQASLPSSKRLGRDTKDQVATPQLRNHVVTRWTMSRHEIHHPLSRQKILYRDRALPITHLEPGHGRALALSRVPARPCAHARTQPPLSQSLLRHHLLCRDLELEMGISPSILVLYTFPSYSTYCKPHRKLPYYYKGNWNLENPTKMYILYKKELISIFFYYKLSKLGLLPRFYKIQEKLGLLPRFLQNIEIKPTLAISSPLRPQMRPIPGQTFST